MIDRYHIIILIKESSLLPFYLLYKKNYTTPTQTLLTFKTPYFTPHAVSINHPFSSYGHAFPFFLLNFPLVYNISIVSPSSRAGVLAFHGTWH